MPKPAAGAHPGATHIEDGEEHQDGDLEHADLDSDAVPNLNAGEDRRIRSCQVPAPQQPLGCSG